eukprot:gene5785-11072_t
MFLEDLKRTLQDVQEMTAPFMPLMKEADCSTPAVDQPTERVNQAVDHVADVLPSKIIAPRNGIVLQ